MLSSLTRERLDAFLAREIAETIDLTSPAVLKAKGQFPRDGLLAISAERVFFVFEDGFDGVRAHTWQRPDIGTPEQRGASVAFTSPDGEVTADLPSTAEAAELCDRLSPEMSEPAPAPAPTPEPTAADEPASPEPFSPPPADLRSAASSASSEASRAGKSGGGPLVAVAIALVVLGAVPLVFLSGGEDDELVAEDPSTAELPAAPKPPPPSAPRGLKGLRFGMTIAAAKQALPELLSGAEELEAATVSADFFDPTEPLSLMTLSGIQVPVPGKRLRVETSLGSHPATCALAFAVEDALSEMICELEGLSTLVAHRAVEQTLVNTLTRRYGPPDSAPDRTGEMAIAGLGEHHEGTWAWVDSEARLDLRSKFVSLGAIANLPPDSEIVLTNTSTEHASLVTRLEEKANRDARAAREEQQRQKAAAQHEEMERLRDHANSLEDDL